MCIRCVRIALRAGLWKYPLNPNIIMKPYSNLSAMPTLTVTLNLHLTLTLTSTLALTLNRTLTLLQPYPDQAMRQKNSQSCGCACNPGAERGCYVRVPGVTSASGTECRLM